MSHAGFIVGLMKQTEIEKGCIVNSRYEVIRQIGTGGTSRVFLVTDRHIGRTLAMKVMDRGALGAIRFAKSEIESLRCVRYPLFPAIHDAFSDDDSLYIISEYVKGTCLTQLIKNGGMNRDRCLAVAERICEALQYLHGLKRPILYLDLKPDNVMVDDEGLPHLIDFGIAGWLAAKHIPVGTIGYSPPEQYEKDAHMDERSDIFAFGMTYYSIRCGVPPDPDPERALYGIIHSRILRASERSFLARCCAISPEDRYSCTREVLKQIRHIRSTPKRIRRKIVFIAVAAGAVTLATYLTTGLSKRIRQDEAAAELMLRATQYMEDGEYSPEGIRIIRACISSNTLSHECEQDMIFEVAMNAMLIAHDHRTAATYFAKLDPARYPQAADYMKLCDAVGTFEEDTDEALSITGELLADIMVRPPSVMKYENLIFISQCYERFEKDEAEGLVKSLSVLDMAMRELSDESVFDIRDKEYSAVKDRVEELMAVKKKRLAIHRKDG